MNTARRRADIGAGYPFAVALQIESVHPSLFLPAFEGPLTHSAGFYNLGCSRCFGERPNTKKKNKMTEPVNSGVPDAPSAEKTAPTAATGTAEGFAAAGTPPPAAAFGATRGSGLARGKRPSAATAAPTPATHHTGEYRPTAVEVIIPQREYKNPFGGATSVTTPDAPQQEEIVPQPSMAVSEPVKPLEVAPAAATPPAPARAEIFGSPEAAVVPEPTPEASASEAKSQLNILPPAETKRTAMHWDKSQSSQSERAPDFSQRPRRDDRRDNRGEGNREGRRDDRPTFRTDGPRPSEEFRSRPIVPARVPTPPPAPASAPKQSGFFGWLKGLFGGAKPAPAPASAPVPAPEREFDSDRDGRGNGHRRRRRGGRGSYGGDREGGPAGGAGGNSDAPQSQGQGGPGGQPGDRRGGEQGGGGGQRRRHRGGRGRNRGGPRSEGQQGGGYI